MIRKMFVTSEDLVNQAAKVRRSHRHDGGEQRRQQADDQGHEQGWTGACHELVEDILAKTGGAQPMLPRWGQVRRCHERVGVARHQDRPKQRHGDGQQDDAEPERAQARAKNRAEPGWLPSPSYPPLGGHGRWCGHRRCLMPCSSAHCGYADRGRRDEVDQEVGKQDTKGDHQEYRLHQWVVKSGDRLVEQVSNARVGENDFGQDLPAENEPDPHPKGGDARQDGIPRRVLDEHARLGEPFGVGGDQVVLREGGDHRVAHPDQPVTNRDEHDSAGGRCPGARPRS